MIEYFVVVLSVEVKSFLNRIDENAKLKILYNLEKARFTLDPKLFKKLNPEIWEFRTKYDNIQYRLYAFWDKTKDKNTIVIVTHGSMKKSKKIPKKEIWKALKIREMYIANKEK